MTARRPLRAQRQGSAKPVAGKCGARLRGADAGRYCREDPVKDRVRCRVHGGTSPRAAAHPRTTHGAYSKGAAAPEILVAPFGEEERRLIDRWRREPEELVRLELAERGVMARRAQRGGNLELYARLGTVIATLGRALVSLREVPPPERGLPKVVEVFEGKTVEDFEHDLEIIRRGAQVGA